MKQHRIKWTLLKNAAKLMLLSEDAITKEYKGVIFAEGNDLYLQTRNQYSNIIILLGSDKADKDTFIYAVSACANILVLLNQCYEKGIITGFNFFRLSIIDNRIGNLLEDLYNKGDN